MVTLPDELTRYWLTFSLADKSPAFFHVTDEGRLLSWGGKIERYSQLEIVEQTFIGDYFSFLAYSFPMQNVTESMQWIETETGLILDAHFHFAATDGWVLLLESSAEAQKVQSLMQQGNELKLLRQKYDKVVQRQLEREESSLILESLLDLSPEHHSKGISILQIRLNQQYAHAHAPQDALEHLNLHLKAVFKTAVEEGGVIHHVFGQTVAVLFGLLPSPLHSAQQAIQAAHRLVTECQRLSISTADIVLGMGVTTGALDIDIRPVKNRKIFHLIGQTIVRAEEMLLMLQPGVLMIDQNTFNLSSHCQSDFFPLSSQGTPVSNSPFFYSKQLND